MNIDVLLAPGSVDRLREIFAGFRADKLPYAGVQQRLLRPFAAWCAANAADSVPADIVDDTINCMAPRYRQGADPPFEALAAALERVFVPRREELFRERFFSPDTPREELIARLCRALVGDVVTRDVLRAAGMIERDVDDTPDRWLVWGVHPRAEFERLFCERFVVARSELGAHARLFCESVIYRQCAPSAANYHEHTR